MLKFFRRIDPAIRPIEDVATPAEIVEHARGGRFEPGDFKLTRLLLGNEAPRPYRRRLLGEGATLYTADLSADRLIVCFSDIKKRLMTPVSVVLQTLDERRHDVLFLADPLELHYDSGVAGLGGSWGEVALALRAFATAGGYASVMCFGTSLGGFPALRGGRLIGADRAISIGGRKVLHVNRLVADETAIGAFDPLCGCVLAPTECVAVYSENNRDDSADARSLGGAQLVAMPGREHNIIQELLERGRLTAFFERLFDPLRPIDAASLRALMR